MTRELDVVIVSYRTEREVERLTKDLEGMTQFPYTLRVFDNIGNPKTLSIAWNDLASQGHGDYLAFLNPDIGIAPGWGAMLVRSLEANPDLGVVLPYLIAGRYPFWIGPVTFYGPWKSEPTSEDMEGIARIMAPFEGVHRLGYGDYWPFYAVAMRRSTWEELKGFDERLRFYGADHDFQDRLAAMGKYTGVQIGLPCYHAGSLSTRRAVNAGDLHVNEEYRFFGPILEGIRKGTLSKWHNLTDQEREAIRKDPRYTQMARP